MNGALRNLWYDELGATSVEYALLLVVVVIGSVGAWTALAGRVREACSSAAGAIAGD